VLCFVCAALSLVLCQIVRQRGQGPPPRCALLFMYAYTEGENESVNHFKQSTEVIHIVIHRHIDLYTYLSTDQELHSTIRTDYG